jgi:hypothetical protein
VVDRDGGRLFPPLPRWGSNSRWGVSRCVKGTGRVVGSSTSSAKSAASAITKRELFLAVVAAHDEFGEEQTRVAVGRFCAVIPSSKRAPRPSVPSRETAVCTATTKQANEELAMFFLPRFGCPVSAVLSG